MLKLLTVFKKYLRKTYAEINTCRNTPDFMCDLELFSKIQSHIIIIRSNVLRQLWLAK